MKGAFALRLKNQDKVSSAGNYEHIPLIASPGIIPVGQAFIVLVYDEEFTDLWVTNDARVHSSQFAGFL